MLMCKLLLSTLHSVMVALVAFWCVFAMKLTTCSAQTQRTVHVRFGYFSEARPVLAACARGWLDLYVKSTDTMYKVGCYPQTSGNFVSSRLDSLQLDLAAIGSTPWSQAVARGVDAQEIYTIQYMGESQGIYVRPNDVEYGYEGIVTPYDLRNRTVGVPFGSTTHYQLLFLIDLLDLTGEVEIVNMSPQEIINAWDDPKRNPPVIDAAAVWGTAREHILRGGAHELRAHTLLSSGVLTDWGRPTYTILAGTRTFLKEHPIFAKHFVGVFSRITDSFIDALGEDDPRNVQRWESQLSPSSYMPSLVDAMMLETEDFQNPSLVTTFENRALLDLFDDKSAEEQLGCNVMGDGPQNCGLPTTHHWSLRETAEFLVGQKVLAGLGPMRKMGDNDFCENEATFCGSDIIDGSFLRDARTQCINCLPVGPYADTTPNVNSSDVSNSNREPDLLLKALEDLDAMSNRPPYASVEIGRAGGDSRSCDSSPIWIGTSNSILGAFGDGANATRGLSYSDGLKCEWEIRGVDCESPFDDCNSVVEVIFGTVRLWSGDRLKIYSDHVTFNCTSESSSYLVAEWTGFHETDSPPVRAYGCLRVVLETDSNEENFYATDAGDGFVARYDRNSLDCVEDLCDCGQAVGTDWAAGCGTTTDACYGTTRYTLSGEDHTVKIASSTDILMSNALLSDVVSDLADYRALDPVDTYPNDAFCSFEIRVVPGTFDFVEVSILYDLEPSYDFVTLLRGKGFQADAVTFITGTHKTSGTAEKYYIPVDNEGFATVRFTSDARGRRRGFTAVVKPERKSDPYLGTNTPCPVPGQSGFNCQTNHCIKENRLIDPAQHLPTNRYILGRVVSQTSDQLVPAMPWAPDGGCVWNLSIDGMQYPVGDAVALRLVFNMPFDLESFPANQKVVGDKLVIKQVKRNSPESVQNIFMEKCENFETCSESWQTGECISGGCAVRDAIQVPFSSSGTDEGGFVLVSLALVTDRNDGDEVHRGLDFDVLLVQQCIAGIDATCQDAGGDCRKGFCYCGEVPCSCPCTENPDVRSTGIKIAIVLGVIIPAFCILFFCFCLYRRRKIRKSRAQKRVIEEKETELEQFRNSVVGMRAATSDYVPIAPTADNIKETARPPPKVQWCWKETDAFMAQHDPQDIYGNSDDCWIRYGNTNEIEEAYQNQKGKGTFSPLPGYSLDFASFIQTKQATGFRRQVERFVEQAGTADVDMSAVDVGKGLPTDLEGESQMILVKGDIIQISKQREDGWAFGSKLHHENEVLARQLLAIATSATKDTSDDTGILTDAGWFPLDKTRQPSGDDLAALQSKVGDTGELSAPSFWDPVNDPTVVQLHDLGPSDPERATVVNSFLSTLVPPHFAKVKVFNVQRVQNLAMWQSYVVKRQTVCYREHKDAKGSAYQRAIDRFERKWLWHGTNAEVMDKILQQGFNRSFCGKNATAYGKGVYFARDAAYSAYRIYAVPDRNGVQYMMACRVVVGEYCRGTMDAVTPDLRDVSKNMLYDTTVGLLTGDTMASPSIYVTYHDSQAYPEYLISFKTS